MIQNPATLSCNGFLRLYELPFCAIQLPLFYLKLSCFPDFVQPFNVSTFAVYSMLRRIILTPEKQRLLWAAGHQGT